MFNHLTFLVSPLRRLALAAAVGVVGTQGAQAQTFQTTYDDGFTYAAVSQSVRQTTDLGYITAGYALYWGGATEVLLSKTNSAGGLVWTKILKSQVPNQNFNDLAFAVREIVIGGNTAGYIVVGTTHEATGGKDVLVIRVDPLGNVLWRKAYGGNLDDVGYNVEVMPDQGGDPNKVNFVVIGYANGGQATGQRVLLMRLADNGVVNWVRNFGAPASGGDEANVGFAVQPQAGINGGFILTGYTNMSGRVAGLDKAPFIIRTNATGIFNWGMIYPGPSNQFGDRYGVGRSIREDANGSIVITGPMQIYDAPPGLPGTGLDAFVLKVSGLGGVPAWFNTYDAFNGSGTYREQGFDIYQAANGNYMMTGTTDFTTPLADHTTHTEIDRTTGRAVVTTRYLFRNVGDPYTLPGIDEEMGISTHKCSNNGFVTEANPYPNQPNGFYLIRTDVAYNSGGCQDVVPFKETGRETVTSGMATMGAAITKHDLTGESMDYYFNEESCVTMKRALPGEEEAPSIGAIVAPNPVRSGETINIDMTSDAVTGTGIETVRISVVDVLGRIVHAETLENGSSSDPALSTEGWSAGSYIVEIASGGRSRSFKVIVTD